MTKPDILAIQQRFLDAGYQVREHIFQDGECIIEVSDSRDPCYITKHGAEIGWGRFSREFAWGKADEWLRQQPEAP